MWTAYALGASVPVTTRTVLDASDRLFVRMSDRVVIYDDVFGSPTHRVTLDTGVTNSVDMVVLDN
jgi:hypothetical protein